MRTALDVRTVLAISPHLDDAAFSAGATLARLAARGWHVIVATVFTGNVERPEGFALACQLDKGLSADADYMALRRAEDVAACTALSAEPVHLTHLEAPHRGYADAPALFTGVRDDDDAEAAVATDLSLLVRRHRPALVLAPRGVGGHVDHVVVRRALDGLDRPRTAYWTDWPYAGKPDAPDPFAAADETKRAALIPATPHLAAKLTACAAYTTQLGYQFGGETGMRDSVGAVRAERFLV